MSIPLDTYFIVTPGSEFISKSYAKLSGTDLFFYVTETNSLRVVNMVSTGGTATPGSTSFTLANGVKWVGTIAQAGIVHVYYAIASGQLFYIPYISFGGTVTPVSLTIGSAQTFSVIHTPQSIPPAFLLLVDDGIHHNLFVATDPMFEAMIASLITYNNSFNPLIYVTRPTISMHPADTSRITVHTQQITVLTSVSQTGWYVVQVPGLS